MPKSNFDPKRVVRSPMSLQVSNVSLRDVGMNAAEASPFVNSGFVADRWKAYMEFDVCHALPAVIGPVSEGFYCAYTAATLAMSHQSLFHQQMNLNHLLKAYEDEQGGSKTPGDRIVGCVVGTYFPDAPEGGYTIGTDRNAAPCIRACAVIFKLASGVNKVIGDHQARQKKQSVSIEAITTLDNLGVYLPSRGLDGVQPLVNITDDAILDALELDPMSLGKVNGEQAVFLYGMGRPVEFRGVGITPRPAEVEARIISFKANEPEKVEGGTLIAMAASLVDQNLMGTEIRFATGRKGLVRKVWTEGRAKITGNHWGMAASAEDPVLEVELPDKRRVLRRMTEVVPQK